MKASKSSPIGLQARGLSRMQAAVYVGVSASSFDQLVADSRMPQPKRIGSQRVWDRWTLDTAFDALPPDDERNSHATRRRGIDKAGDQAALLSGQAPWQEQLKQEPLNKREQMTLRALIAFGLEWTRSDSVKGASVGTQVRLEVRGLVETRGMSEGLGEWRLTAAGLEAAKSLHPPRLA